MGNFNTTDAHKKLNKVMVNLVDSYSSVSSVK